MRLEKGRIIPARAGFTVCIRPLSGAIPDHPRSRGVYEGGALGIGCGLGSSPLARGLPPRPARARHHHRIIPARAGFTAGTVFRLIRDKDHPRSRGVYSRGGRRHRDDRWIIPARAGFTASWRSAAAMTRDHPRSRGVYHVRPEGVRLVEGSSPLARGLPPTTNRENRT